MKLRKKMLLYFCGRRLTRYFSVKLALEKQIKCNILTTWSWCSGKSEQTLGAAVNLNDEYRIIMVAHPRNPLRSTNDNYMEHVCKTQTAKTIYTRRV